MRRAATLKNTKGFAETAGQIESGNEGAARGERPPPRSASYEGEQVRSKTADKEGRRSVRVGERRPAPHRAAGRGGGRDGAAGAPQMAIGVKIKVESERARGGRRRATAPQASSHRLASFVVVDRTRRTHSRRLLAPYFSNYTQSRASPRRAPTPRSPCRRRRRARKSSPSDRMDCTGLPLQILCSITWPSKQGRVKRR